MPTAVLFSITPRYKQGPKDVEHFKDEEVSSVQERTLFEQIFLQIMKKDEEKKRSKNLLEHIPSDKIPQTKNDESVQIVFEKKTTSESEKLQNFFKDTTGEKAEDVGEFARITTDDIRKYPVSLTSTYFTQSSENGINAEESPYMGVTSLKEALSNTAKKEQRENKQALDLLETKQQLEAALGKALEPHFQYLNDRIKTDFDCLEVIDEYLDVYRKREKHPERQSKSTLEHIEESCKLKPHCLPQPYFLTLPYTIRYLFVNEEFNFPSSRKYTLISLIYHRAKRSQDFSLYLNVCNVDFYNLLLQYCWENFKEIHQLKQLVTEMSVNGIMGDHGTISLLDKVVQDMRFINDGILNETDVVSDPSTVGTVWCRENSEDLDYVEKYLVKLKQTQL